MMTIALNKDNYKQYTPFDIVAVWEMSEVVDRSKHIFKITSVEDGIQRVPLHEIFNCPEDARLDEVFPESEWSEFRTGMGTGGLIHSSIRDEFFKRTNGLSPLEVRKCWRDIVLEILEGRAK